MTSPGVFGAAGQIQPPAPGEHPIAWAARNPDALNRMIALHNQLSNLEVVVVKDGVTTRCPLFTAAAAGNAVIQINT